MKISQLFVYILLMFTISSCAPTTRPPIFTLPDTPPEPREIKDVNVALVLGGGGAKGIAHLGVIEVLEKHGIPIDLIVGTSAGSIVGAMYADYKDSKLLYDQLIKIKKWDLIDISFADSLSFFSELRGPAQGYYLEDFLVRNLTVNNIEDLKIPFVAVASDLEQENAYVFDSGPIAPAVHASAAIPPVFSPVKIYGKVLVDGGVVEPVPVRVAEKYNPKVIIAVDISTTGREYGMANMLDVTGKSLSISYYLLSQLQSSRAHVLIHPDLNGYGTFDDHANKEMYEIGRKAAIRKLPEIIMELRRKKIIN
jgi:NTE family protein